MKQKDFLYYWLPVILVAGLIFGLSSLSQPPSVCVGGCSSCTTVFLHVIEYFVLAALLLRALKHHAAKHPYLFAILFAALYGVTDEVHQLFVSGRVFSWLDIGADALGAIFIIFIYILIEG